MGEPPLLALALAPLGILLASLGLVPLNPTLPLLRRFSRRGGAAGGWLAADGEDAAARLVEEDAIGAGATPALAVLPQPVVCAQGAGAGVRGGSKEREQGAGARGER